MELMGRRRKSGKFKRIREVQEFVKICLGLGQEGIQRSWRGAGSSLDTSSWRQAGGWVGRKPGRAFEVVAVFGGWRCRVNELSQDQKLGF